MNYDLVRNNLILYLKNLPGWSTHRKIVIFISDDWGELRIRNEEDYFQLLRNHIPVDKSPHTRYGALATYEDLDRLFDTLTQVKDKYGRSAVFTPFTIMANPDFEKIQQDNFEKYHYEIFTDTIKKYDGGNKTLTAWAKGMEERIFLPELHGREHLNVPLWLRFLKQGNEELLMAFKHHYAYLEIPEMPVSPVLAFYFENECDLQFLIESLSDGIRIFNDVFKRKPVVFNPPNGMFHTFFYNQLVKSGVQALNTQHFRLQPCKNGKVVKKYFRFGEVSKEGIIHIIANCAFEPFSESYKGIDLTMKQIDVAFKCKKPALINTHRVNYIGSRNQAVRGNSLLELSFLLKQIIKRWQDVEFMSAGEFISLLKDSRKY